MTEALNTLDNNNNSSWTAIYQLNLLAGNWEDYRNGVYSIWIQPEQVNDVNSNYVTAGLIGSFVVDISPSDCVVLAYYRIDAFRDISPTVRELDLEAHFMNNCAWAISNKRFVIIDTADYVTLLQSSALVETINGEGVSVAKGLVRIRVDHSDNTFNMYDDLSWQIIPWLSGDFGGNGIIATDDLILLSQFWLQNNPYYDIAPVPNGDGRVDLNDFMLLAKMWLDVTN